MLNGWRFAKHSIDHIPILLSPNCVFWRDIHNTWNADFVTNLKYVHNHVWSGLLTLVRAYSPAVVMSTEIWKRLCRIFLLRVHKSNVTSFCTKRIRFCCASSSVVSHELTSNSPEYNRDCNISNEGLVRHFVKPVVNCAWRNGNTSDRNIRNMFLKINFRLFIYTR